MSDELAGLDERLRRAAAGWSAAKAAALQAERHAAAAKRRIEIFNAGNPPARNANNQNLEWGGAWGAVYKKIEARLGTGFMFLLYGASGPGKTQAGVELMREAAAAGRTCKYATAAGFFLELKAGFRDRTRPSELEVVEAHCRPALLVLDEVGKRGESEWEGRILGEVLNRRYNAGDRDTLLVTNQGVDEAEASLGPSLSSRIKETGGMIECHWPSFRM